jgi:hypothetical protein
VTQSDIVCDFTVIADRVHSVYELDPGFLVFAFLVENATLVDYDIRVFMVA